MRKSGLRVRWDDILTMCLSSRHGIRESVRPGLPGNSLSLRRAEVYWVLGARFRRPALQELDGPLGAAGDVLSPQQGRRRLQRGSGGENISSDTLLWSASPLTSHSMERSTRRMAGECVVNLCKLDDIQIGKSLPEGHLQRRMMHERDSCHLWRALGRLSDLFAMTG